MEELAKSAEQAKPAPKPEHTHETKGSLPGSDNIDMEVYHYFNLRPNEKNPQLRFVSDWATKDTSGIGEVLQRIQKVERKVGQPAIDETRLSRIYNYLRMSDSVQNTNKKINQEISSKAQDIQNKLSKMKKGIEEKKQELDQQIKLMEEQYKIAERNLKLQATEHARNIHRKYGKQLKELKSLRDVYKGGRK